MKKQVLALLLVLLLLPLPALGWEIEYDYQNNYMNFPELDGMKTYFRHVEEWTLVTGEDYTQHMDRLLARGDTEEAIHARFGEETLLWEAYWDELPQDTGMRMECFEDEYTREVWNLYTLSTKERSRLVETVGDGLLLEKYHTLIKEGKLFDEIVAAIKDYMQRTHLLFSLESLNNFARIGRVSPAVAKVAGILGLRIVGSAKDGDLDPAHKCRGEKKALAQIFASMKEMGYKGGKVRITHSDKLNMAETLRNMIRGEQPESDVTIGLNRGLCCFYCEEGGLLVGFEI